MKRLLFALCVFLVVSSNVNAEGITYSFNGLVVNSEYSKKVSLSAGYRGEFWTVFKDFEHRAHLNLNINLHKYVSFMPFGFEMNIRKSLDSEPNSYTWKDIAWNPGVHIHIPVKQFIVGGNVYFKSEFNLKDKTSSGNMIDPDQFYRPYFGVLVFGAVDLGTIQPIVMYNFDGHINFELLSGFQPKHLITAGANIKLANNFVIISPDVTFRLFPNAPQKFEKEAIIGLSAMINIK